MNLISIIVPIYNAETYLGQCIESLINQTYENIEIILVNDGSNDNSLRICNDYTKKTIGLQLSIRLTSVSVARNAGLIMLMDNILHL